MKCTQKLIKRGQIVCLACPLFFLPGAALATGRVTAWGNGHGDAPANLTNVVAISSAIDHSLALKADGTVAAWGHNFDGQCDVPAGLNNVSKVAAGSFFSLAVKTDGSIVGWGSDDYNQLKPPAGLTSIKSISAGHGHVVGLRSNGTVVAWGSNIYGQTNVPAGLNGIAKVFATWNYTLAVRSNGTVAAWGANDSGTITVPEGLTGVVDVSGNIEYSLALRNDGTLVAWGRVPASFPGDLSGLSGVAAGEHHILGLQNAGNVLVWGSDESGEGVVPEGLANVTALTAGWNYSLALVGSSGSSLAPFRLVGPKRMGGQFVVSLASQGGRNYRLEHKDTLADGPWTQMPWINGTGGMIHFTNTSVPNGLRVYRVVGQ